MKFIAVRAGAVGKGFFVALALTGAALAQTSVPTEVTPLGGATVTLHMHDFLTPEELATLRLVASNEQALALFVPGKDGFAAMAASPEEGVIRDAKPVVSAVALAGLEDAAEAQTAALAACDAARKTQSPCVIVLEVSPAE